MADIPIIAQSMVCHNEPIIFMKNDIDECIDSYGYRYFLAIFDTLNKHAAKAYCGSVFYQFKFMFLDTT